MVYSRVQYQLVQLLLSMGHWVSAILALGGAMEHGFPCHHAVCFGPMEDKNLVKTWHTCRRHSKPCAKKMGFNGKGAMSCTQKLHVVHMPSRLRRRLVRAAVLVVWIRACWDIPRHVHVYHLVILTPALFPSVAPLAQNIPCHGIPWFITPLSSKIAKPSAKKWDRVPACRVGGRVKRS